MGHCLLLDLSNAQTCVLFHGQRMETQFGLEVYEQDFAWMCVLRNRTSFEKICCLEEVRDVLLELVKSDKCCNSQIASI